MTEEWRRVADYPNYEVSNLGRIRNRWQIMWPQRRDNGHYQIKLSNNGKAKSFYMHRLIASTFVPGEAAGLEAFNINGDKDNLAASNLRWGTHQDNIRNAYANGMIRTREVEIIETGEKFETITACAKHVGGRVENVWHVLNGKAKTYRGYTFRYIN